MKKERKAIISKATGPTLKTYRLSESHPTMDKLAQLFEFADKLGIQINYSYAPNQVIVKDKDQKSEFILHDADSNEPVLDFPAFSEYKLIYDK